MTKASKILISFYLLKIKAKAQLELKSFGSYHHSAHDMSRMILIQAVLLLWFLTKNKKNILLAHVMTIEFCKGDVISMNIFTLEHSFPS